MALNLASCEEAFQLPQNNFLPPTRDDMVNKQEGDTSQILKVLQNLKTFRDDGRFCDVVIHVNNTKFTAHRAVLAAWSPMLALEILGKAEAGVELVVQCSEPAVFTACLDFMYSGLLTVSESNVLHLLQLGKTLMLESMLHKCEDFLSSRVDDTNFVDRYFTALRYSLKHLQLKVLDYVQMNITSVIERNELLNIEPQDFKVFLTEGKMANLKQEMKFSIIISWVGLNLPERDKFLLHLFDQIYWLPSVTDLLVQISCTTNIFTTNEFCLFQLLHSLATSQGHHLGPFITTYPRLFSTYSHMLEDLAQPKVFKTPSRLTQESYPVSINLKYDKVQTQKTKPEMKDTGVNTEVCFDNFEVESDSENSEFLDSTHSIDKQKKSIVNHQASLENALLEDTGKSSTGINVNPTHRRKSLPRKIPMNSNNKEKKSRKPKKSQVKDLKMHLPIAVKKEKISDDFNEDNDTTVEELLEPSEFVSENILMGLGKDEHTVDYDIGGRNNDANGTDTEPTFNSLSDSIRNTADGLAGEGGGNTDGVKVESGLDTGKVRVKSRIRNTLKSGHRRGRPAGSKNKTRDMKLKEEKKKKPKNPHKMSVPRLPKIHCTYEDCDFSSRTADVLEKHVERVHMIDVELRCHKCDFTTNEMKALCLHVKTHYTKLPYCCDVENCTMTFMRIGLYIRHTMTHMNLRPYKCDLCCKQFASYNQLSCHKKLHEGRQFQCDVCLKRFTTKGVMQQHRMIHFSNKPYLCDTCGFSTKHQSHLISHRKIHTGDVLRCTFPSCPYTTPKQGHMTQHMNSHLNIRNHICQVCGKSFVVRGKLLRHERIHLKEKLFKCKQCDYQTSRTDRMKLHIESHGIKFPKKKYNIPNFEEKQEDDDIDFHQFYEKIHTVGAHGDVPDMNLNPLQPQPMHHPAHNNLNNPCALNTSIPFMSMTDMKPIDVISFAASSSMIVDNYNPGRYSTLDPLSTAAAVANIDHELHTATNFVQNFERIHTTSFDQL